MVAMPKKSAEERYLIFREKLRLRLLYLRYRKDHGGEECPMEKWIDFEKIIRRNCEEEN